MTRVVHTGSRLKAAAARRQSIRGNMDEARERALEVGRERLAAGREFDRVVVPVLGWVAPGRKRTR